MGVAIFMVLAFVMLGVERLVTHTRCRRAPPAITAPLNRNR
jgi:hypothetical protein